MRREVRPATSIQALFVLFGIVVAAFFPFFALFLNDRGLSAGQIGVVIAITALARVLCNPVWGHLSDSTLGRRRALQIGTLGSAVAAAALFFTSSLGPILVVAFGSPRSRRRRARTSTRSRSCPSATIRCTSTGGSVGGSRSRTRRAAS